MKLQINILPAEFIFQNKQKQKQQLINRVSLTIVSFVVVTTAILLILRLFQQQDLSQLRQDQEDYTIALNNFNNEANMLKTLKTRLQSIDQLSQDSSTAVIGLELMNRLKPPAIATNHLEINSLGNLSFSGESSNSADLDVFFNRLTDSQQNEGKISQTKIDNLTRLVNTGKLRFDLTMMIVK